MGHRRAAEGHRVLIAAPYGSDAESVAAVLRRDGYDALPCRDLAAVGDALDERIGAILLTEEALATGFDRFAQALAAQPAWSDVPILLLATARGRAGAAWTQLAEAISNAVILERPIGTASLISAIAAAMRSRQKQFEMRDRLGELAASEGRLRLAADAAAIGTWDYDPVANRLSWDRRCKAMFGLPADAEVSYEASFLAGIHLDDRQAAHEAVSRALDPSDQEVFDIEYRTIGLQDGIERWIAARGGTVFEEGQAVRFIGTTIDISRKKADEALLLSSQDALRQESRALETLNRIGEWMAAELDPDRLVQGVVEAAAELVGASVGAFFYTRRDPSGDTLLLYALAGAPREAFEGFPMPRRTAIFGPTFLGEGPVRSADIRQDPRYGLEEPHRGMPAGHLPIVSYLAVPVVSRSGEVIGGLFFGHPEPDRFDARAERIVAGIAAQAATAIDNARLFQAAQRARDTLEEKVAERTAALEAEMAQRAAAEAALRQSQKMEAVGQLTGGIAHDFNNMLTGVIGAMDIMKRRLASGRTDDLDRFMEAASTSAQRAAALTARLLAFSRRQSLDARPIDVDMLVHGLEDLLRRALGENISLAILPGVDVPLAVTDANQLENAILNLAINARDAMPAGGQLTIETRAVTLDARQAAAQPGMAAGRYVVLMVSDTGVGIEAEVLERIFEPFFSTKPIGQGTGLGLSMVYGFARQSGGQVRVHSKPGQGTCVSLYLPAADAAPDEAEAPGPALTVEGHGQTVLVVEDDASVRLLVREVLTELSYDVIEAADASGAIPVLASGRHLDLMISDVGLPGMNGRQLAEVARQHRPQLPILFVTGYAENAAIRAGFLGTNMAMITKPFAIEALSAKVNEMLSG